MCALSTFHLRSCVHTVCVYVYACVFKQASADADTLLRAKNSLGSAQLDSHKNIQWKERIVYISSEFCFGEKNKKIRKKKKK